MSSPERPSGKVGRLCPKVLASMTSSTGESTLSSPCSGKLTGAGISCTRADTPSLGSAAALYSAMRLPLAEPASREGICVVMCSTWAFTWAADTALTTPSSDMLMPRHPARKLRFLRNFSPQRRHLAANLRACHERGVPGAQARAGMAQDRALSAKGICDPITLEIVRGALIAIQSEMEAVIERTAMSPFIREKKDFYAALYDAEGRL